LATENKEGDFAMSDGTETPAAQSADAQDEGEVIKIAWEEYRSGHHESGLGLLKKGLVRSPASVPLHLELARMYQELANPNKIIEYCAKALKIDPQNSMACALMGYAYIARRQTDKAVPLLRKAIQLDPNNTYAYEDLGRIVLAGTMSVVDMNPNYLNASISFTGDAPVEVRLLEDGIKYRQRGCKNNWDWLCAYYRMGVLYYYAGHPVKVRACINAAAGRGYEPAKEWQKEG
jgi:tetratricopeptide (TPR) repeat protein